MKHTPGPWAATQAPGNWYKRRWSISSSIYSKPNISDGRDSIADVMGQTEEESRANANLIAAAPVGYELLNYLFNRINEYGLIQIKREDSIWVEIRDFLAKAEGRDQS